MQVLQEKPKVFYVINSFDRGGAEAGLVALVQGGLFKGCQLTIVALVRGTGGLETKLSTLGYLPHIICDGPRMKLLHIPRIFGRLRQILLKAQPDIVVASLPQANILSRLCLIGRPRTLFISFEHNTHLAKRIYEIAYRLTSSRVDWMFGDAAATLDVAARRLYRNVPVRRTVVPLISFAESSLPIGTRAPSKPFHIVCAARLIAIKNQDRLIEAIAILVRQNRSVTLTFFGEGSKRRSFEAIVADLGIAQHVKFPGYVANWHSLPADLFLLASKHEGLCMAVLEAMNAGIPVAARIVGGIADYGDSAVLRPLKTAEPAQIAAAISALMDDEMARRHLSAQAKEMINRRFGRKAVRRIYEQINEALIAEIQMGAGQGGASRRHESTSATSARVGANL